MKVRLTTLCPTHIGGSDQRIGTSELVVLDGRCFVIHKERLSRALLDRGLLESFVDALSRSGHELDIAQFLDGHGLLSPAFLSEHASHSCACRADRIRELRSFIRDAHGQPYLPGSTIKGVLRTSILYGILDRLDEEQRARVLDEFVRSRLSDFRKDPRSQMRRSWFREQFKLWFAQELDRRFFQSYQIGRQERRFGSHSDLMRAIVVSDACPLDRDSLDVEEIKIHSAESDHSPKDWSIYAECVARGSDFVFDVRVDNGILQEFSKSTSESSVGVPLQTVKEILAEPLEAVSYMTRALYKHEVEFYKKEALPPEALDFRGIEPNFRVGWGIGLLGTSVSLLLPAKILQDLRNTLFVDRGETPAPKSRKVALTAAGNASLGWCFAEVER